MTPEARLAKLEALLKLVDESVSREDLQEAIGGLIAFVKKIENKTETDLKTIIESVKTAISRIETTASDNHTKTSEKLTKEAETLLNDARFQVEAMIAEAQKKIDEVHSGEDGMDGLDADEDVIVEKLLERIPTQEIVQVNLEPIEEKIDALEKRIGSIRTAPFIGPSRGIFLKINGVKQGLVNELNIVGSGVALTTVNGLPTVTITGGSGVTAVETPTGTVNGANTTFTVAHEPLYIIVDGVSKFKTLHYTYNAGTVEITDGAPPVQYLRSVYSA